MSSVRGEPEKTKWERMIRRDLESHVDILRLVENHSFRPLKKGEPISFQI